MHGKPENSTATGHVPEARQWERDEFLFPLKPVLSAAPRKFSLVSFDFFDTLVHRLVPEPDDMFYEVGRRMEAGHLLIQPMSPEEFANARKMADRRARQRSVNRGGHVEVQLRDIYEEMRNVVIDPERGVELEICVEKDFCFLNPAMADLVKWLRALGFRTAILSDTYFSRDQLGTLMDAVGLDQSLFDLVLVSNEHAAAKWESTLFPLALRLLGLHGNEVLHIGDNPGADFQCAKGAGIIAHLYPKMTSTQEEVFLREGRSYSLPLPVSGGFHSLRALSSRQCVRNGKPDPAFRDGAFLLGPPLARYADWCVDRFRNAGFRKVFALMREGELLGELVSRSAADSGTPLDVVTCFASRISTALATLVEFTPERLREILTGGPILTLRDAFEILEVGEARNALSETELLQKLDNDRILNTFIATVMRGNIRKLVEGRARARLDEAAGYFRELAGADRAIGFLDLGWSGSIQRNIVKILELSGTPVISLGCYFATTRRSARMALDGHPAVAFLEASWDKSTLLLENAITATTGSTEGYIPDEAGIYRPRLGPFDGCESEMKLKSSLREGILCFQERWLAVRRKLGPQFMEGEPLREIDRSLRHMVHRLIDFPTQSEAQRFGALEHDENYGILVREKLVPRGAERTLRREGISALIRSERSHWPAGVVAMETPAVTRSLSLRWDAPVPVALSGQHSRRGPGETGWTEGELQGLERIVATLKPSRVVNFGQGLTGDAWFLADALQRGPEDEGHPPIGILDVVPPEWTSPGDIAPRHCYRIAGRCGDLDTLKAVRKWIEPELPTLVLFDRSIPGSSFKRAMSYLAPVMALGSTFALVHGDSDPLALGDPDQPSPQALLDWFLQVGIRQDFGMTASLNSLSSLSESWSLIGRVSASLPSSSRGL